MMKWRGIAFCQVADQSRQRGRVNDRPEPDMLRYDFAFECEAYPGVVAFPVLQDKDGSIGGRVTYGRWRSFGQDLQQIAPSTNLYADVRAHFSQHPEQWVTRVHPRVGGQRGYTDHDRLAKQTFAAYLEAKKFSDAVVIVKGDE